ncbi:Retroelement pol Polyprotein [Phytophthora megakarya]|uniref:Retroelement pol Polyprotein n=1 Tax=Phytophthora megakarya TaxID=4795 RepID=A0A225W1U8_9STRA|nr:Retroelement pol Polyprotein [Phytophthora megakarya]
MVRCMLFRSGLPLYYWGYAADYAAYVLNRMPTRANVGRQSPIEVLTGKPGTIADIVAFGSPCMVYASPKKALDRRGTPGIIVGKNEETKGYKVIVVKHQTLITTRHVSNIETLSTEANEQLKNVLEREAENELEALAD